jgi:hypothetical protein
MRARITTTIAKDLAKKEGLDGANAIIERALELYFSSFQSEGFSAFDIFVQNRIPLKNKLFNPTAGQRFFPFFCVIL